MQSALKTVRDRYPYIFSHRPKVAVELGAYNVLGTILRVYANVVKQLSRNAAFDQLSFVQRRYIALAWSEGYVRENEGRRYAWWLARVMDFVAGMTDNYATQVAGEISGT